MVQTQLWEKPIYKVLSSFRKQHILSGLFSFGGKGNQSSILKYFFSPTTQLHVNALTHAIYCQFHTGFTNWQSILISRNRQQILTACLLSNFKFLAVVVMVLFQMWRFVRQTPQRSWKWCVNLFTFKSYSLLAFQS